MSLRQAWVGAARLAAGTFGALTNGLTSSMPEAATADRNVDMLIGGQAVIEGVMMRGLSVYSNAVRTADRGYPIKTGTLVRLLSSCY